MEYMVNIRETLEKQVGIEADSAEEALCLAEKNWKDARYVLDSECFTDVKFSLTEQKNNS